MVPTADVSSHNRWHILHMLTYNERCSSCDVAATCIGDDLESQCLCSRLDTLVHENHERQFIPD